MLILWCKYCNDFSRIILLLVFCIYCKDAHSACGAIYQDVRSSIDGNFFNPDITVCAAWPFCYSCTNMKAGECRYVFPTNVMAYIDDKSGKSKICMCQVFACDLPWDPAQWVKKCIPNSVKCVESPIAPYIEPFCNIIKEDEYFNVKFVPMEFSKQNFFTPGVVVVVEDNTGIYKYEKKLVDNKYINDKYMSYDFVHQGTKYFFEASKKEDLVCIRYYGTDVSKKLAIENNCLPIPTLDGIMFLKKEQFLSIKSNGDVNNLPIKFKNNIAYFGDDNNIDDLVNNLLRAKVVYPVKDNDYKLQTIQHKRTNAKCISFPFKKYTQKEHTNTYLLINALPRILRRYVSIENGKHYRYIKCSDVYSLDLQTMRQEDINDAIVRNNVFTFSKRMFYGNVRHGVVGTPCEDENLRDFYVYEEGIFDITEQCSNPVTIYYNSNESFKGCDYKYASVDGSLCYFNASYKSSKENNMQVSLRDLYDQELCIDNFKKSGYLITYRKTKNSIVSNVSSSYLVTDYYDRSFDEKGVSEIKNGGKQQDIVVNTGDIKHIYNSPLKHLYGNCDFLKIEVWGGGQAASKKGSVMVLGRPGEYAVGILSNKKIQEYSSYNLIINVGSGGINNGQNGKSTYVELCNNEAKCERLITAKGGGDLSVREVHSSSIIYHSIVPGTSAVSDNIAVDLTKKYNVLVPYFSLNISLFAEKQFFDYIFNHSYVLKDFALRNHESCIQRLYWERYKVFFPGAGGCINIKQGIADIGNNGAAILTCEQWKNEH
ncbi:hypothetical protein [Candidatus Neoehrlichia procyonis]|uniref:Uncharacterized protein n=1 Tax=Candidatus Neoehrlichia procyonis str. RAC413 TaxID=1359163 RepID=A0A0F3NN57_9RICK|nr:hypothetical protein [Candidatus Neoehrlichia lotoris]KJV69495.1 hypothetical protein NLO413_0888 [Candidatus Neoehrlichia lotoris str. RAC413]